MITPNSFIQRLLNHLNNSKIATIEDLKIVLDTQSRMTVFRCLRKMDYISLLSQITVGTKFDCDPQVPLSHSVTASDQLRD